MIAKIGDRVRVKKFILIATTTFVLALVAGCGGSSGSSDTSGDDDFSAGVGVSASICVKAIDQLLEGLRLYDTAIRAAIPAVDESGTAADRYAAIEAATRVEAWRAEERPDEANCRRAAEQWEEERP